MLTVEKQWINVQQKTFTKWLNDKLKVRKIFIDDLVVDLSDGVILIHLLEILGGESLGRYASKPKLRVQKFENVNKSLDFIKGRRIPMTNIGAEDVVDGNRKIILGLIWTLILRFTISDINAEGMTAKAGLLLWCQRKTACYEGVEVRDFSTSWNDGLAFCALLDIHRPDLIDFDALDKKDHRGNMKLAFDIAANEIGIPDLLDVDDVCDQARPDEKSLMTYIAYWFHAFSQLERVENAGRRVEKFINNMHGAWEMQNSYERRMRELLRVIRVQREAWKNSSFEGTYKDAKEQAHQFSLYKRNQKRQWVAEKSDLAALLGNIKTKLSTYRLRPYQPPKELSLEVCDEEWEGLTRDEHERSQLINETIRDIKNALRRSFADKANDFALTLKTLSLAISGLDGDVEDQLAHVKRLNDNLPPLDAFLDTIAALDEQCAEANIEENDYTTYTLDELSYELSLVKSSISKKLAFLDNQLVARNMTNLTPIQLEEFESVFRHFDRDASNTLHELEFSAALASLGLVYDEEEMHDVYVDTCGPARLAQNAGVSFEQFIRFMVSVTEDQNTAEQVYQSFREVADGKPYVTELDLRHSLIPDEVIEHLVQTMPPHNGPDLQEDRDLPKYDYISFMEKMIEHNNSNNNDSLNGGTRPSRAPRRPRGDRYSPSPEHTASSGAKLRVENIHYDITETDLEDLFTRIGPISNVSLVYDRAGRSEGVAFVTYSHIGDARTAIREFDGANAKGQPIRLTLISTGAGRRDRNPFDNVERSKGSLFDRVERPRDRDARSLSPDSRSGSPDGGARRRRGRRGGGGGGYRRSDVSKPAPEHIDRYIPGQRSPTRNRGATNGRRQGGGGENKGDSRRMVNGRPRKTQEELDQEMDDYWGGSGNAGAGAADKEVVPDEPQQIAPASAAAAGDDDIDMIE
ncbi:alpha-actinin, sarcomeric [Aspergillus phoenicis ATCC 13157]|uniref:Alpha-actinin, sarcomeric n=1 Tax=Aspergillus phoenicis ATCC 13157 TaxID=1353007 RepID=A0A370PAB4_ASPPH|nr:alpha-actinin, sarcomeric [Aspergillus phoenicis ATCC 13157]